MEAHLPVRPACYTPRQTDPAFRRYAVDLTRRRNAGTLWELSSLATFLAAVLLWAGLATGGL